MAKRFRLQRRDIIGSWRNRFGGSGASWSSWRTVAKFDDLDAAIAEALRFIGQGLRQYRICYGERTINLNGRITAAARVAIDQFLKIPADERIRAIAVGFDQKRDL